MSKKNNVPKDKLKQKSNDSKLVNDSLVSKKEDNVVFNEVYKKKYFSFEARVGWMIFLIVVCFTTAGIFIFKTFDFGKEKSALYSENSFINYQVCLKDNNLSCLGEDMEYYTSYIDTIDTSFKYVLNYMEDTSYKYYYYVIGKVKIYDQNESDKVVYKDEEVLVPRTKMEDTSNEADLLVDVSVPIQKYNDYVNKYKSKNSLDSSAVLEVSLYVESNDKNKRVANLTVPLSVDKFSIEKKVVSNENLENDEDLLNDVDVFYATVAVLFSLLGLLVVIRLSNLFCKVVNSGNGYQKRLRQILRDYDKIIVVSRKDYAIDEKKEFIKVKSFNDLLEVRECLEKPIVYVRVNNIKSEFYVENKDKVYRYTMKDVDFEGR